MSCSINLHIGSDQAIFSDSDFVVIKKHAIGIDEGIFPDFDVEALVTEKGSFNPHPGFYFAQKLI
jgi:hypothetical protein